MIIKKATVNHTELYFQHGMRLLNSNGEGGIIFFPRDKGSFNVTTKDLDIMKERWNKDVFALGHESA